VSTKEIADEIIRQRSGDHRYIRKQKDHCLACSGGSKGKFGWAWN
jgi:hypothetical protein